MILDLGTPTIPGRCNIFRVSADLRLFLRGGGGGGGSRTALPKGYGTILMRNHWSVKRGIHGKTRAIMI